ncbi:MAG: hypothetical protein NVV73_00910 [Cellvibrionaceae bacterium]|nr:hypothetical protein [Cellvibrionaceae bacterium]
MAELNLSNANPGDVVVPLADVLELLQTALNTAELQQLSTELIARRTTFVQAGDVITAELMNQVLADIGNLQARVADLENGIPSQEAPRIIFVNPNTGVRIGETLTVIGENLAPANLTSVRIGNRAITAFSGSSSGKTLAFAVPPMLGISQNGSDVLLTISNDFGSDDILVRVLPSLPQNLTANMVLTYVDFPQEELEPNTTYTVTLRLSAFTTLEADFAILPSLDGDAGWSVVVDGDDTITVPRSQQQPFITDIDLLVTTGASGSASLTVQVEAVEYPDQNRTSTGLPLAIGDTPEVNTDIALSAQNIPPGSFNTATSTFLVNQGQTVPFVLQFDIEFYPQETGESAADFAAKNTYVFDAPSITPTGPWSLTHQLPQTVVATPSMQLVSLSFQLTRGSGPITTSELRFQASRNDADQPPFELLYNLTNA